MKHSSFVLTVATLWIALALALPASSQAATPIKIWIPGWKSTAPMNTPRASAAVVHHGQRLYVLGGIDGRDFIANTEFTTIQPDGTLLPWQSAPELKESRGFHGAVIHSDYVYVVGGGNGPNGHNLLRSAERARVNPDGLLGPWQQEKHALVLPRRCVKLIAYANRLYAIGGFGGTLLDSVESASILPDGSLGPWTLENKTLTIPRYVHDAKLVGDSFWIVGGHRQDQGMGLVEAESRAMNTSESTWQSMAPLQRGRYGLALAVHDRFVYALGGLDGADFLRTVERHSRDNKPDAKWISTAPLSSSRANFSAVFHSDTLYLLGGTNAMGYYDSVEYTTVNAQGELGFWGTRDEAKAYEKRDGGTQATLPLPVGNTGIIKESIAAGGYTYLRVVSTQGEEWLATSQGNFPVGGHITFSEGVTMNHFRSKALDREFDKIRFVSQVRVMGREPDHK